MNKIISLLIALTFVISAASPALAQSPSGDEALSKREEAKLRAEAKRETTEQRKAEIKTAVAARKETIKQDVCEKRQAKLQQLIPKLSANAEKHKGVIDSFYEKVQNFYDKGQLTVSNYDELNANVALAKANAETALETLNAYEFELNCEDSSAGEQLDAYRTAVKETREVLKAYRKSLVELISSMRAAAAEENAQQDESDSEENTEENNETEGAENENQQ